MKKRVEEMSRKELIQVYTEVYGGKLSDLGDGYIPIATLREAVSLSFSLSLNDSEFEKTIRASSDFGFIEQEEAEELDREADETQYEWITIPGSSAKRRRKKK